MNKIILAVVEKKDKILILKRKENDGIVWAFPGGEIEKDESAKHAAKREVKEETNIVCDPIRSLGSRIHPVTKVKIIYWLCQYKSGELKISLPLEIEKIEWIPKQSVTNRLGSTLFINVKKYLLEWF